MESKPLIVIIGPTASGKSALAVDLAKQFNGEIICADSRTVYQEMDLGTAKPSLEMQSIVPHWGLDLVRPDELFTAADFKKYADQKINEIRMRGNTPFLVGGTGLYIDAVVFDYKFGAPVDNEFRKELEAKSLEELHRYCIENNITMPENSKNKRYVIRAIEQKNINNKRLATPKPNTHIVGIATDKEELSRRIALRSEQLFADGIVSEAKKLGKKYGWESEAMTGNVYPLCRMFLAGEITYDEIIQKNSRQDWRLAKRQITWFKRNKYVQWFPLNDAKNYLLTVLASEQ